MLLFVDRGKSPNGPRCTLRSGSSSKALYHAVLQPGVGMEVYPEDGSNAWTELYEQALQGPVRDQR